MARRAALASLAAISSLVTSLVAGQAFAQRSVTARAAQLFGAHGVEIMAGKPAGSSIGAIVEVPAGADLDALGLVGIVPGIAVLRGDAGRIAGFVQSHPELPLEIPPPMHTVLDVAVPFVAAERARLGWPGQPGAIDGKGVYVGIVDTGLDVFHPAFRNPDGTTRVAWLLDLSQKPRTGNAADTTYGGRVFSRADLDLMLKAGPSADGVPNDLAGHGTHVAGIAAGNGAPEGVYVGVAPSADLVIVRATRDASGSLDEADALTGTKFVFDMAHADARPAVVNLSIGSQFGPHDGTSTFEQGLVLLGQGQGRAVVVAASNEGQVFKTDAHPWAHGIHTSLRVSAHAKFEIPLGLDGPNGDDQAYGNAEIFAWLNFRDGGEVHVTLKGPDGSTWVDDVGPGEGFQSTQGSVVAQVINDVHDGGTIPRGTHGAVVSVKGPLSPGSYTLVLEGEGAVEAWVQGVGDAADEISSPYFSRGPQLEGTIGIPASADGLVSIGCVDVRTVFRKSPTQIFNLDGSVPGTRCFFSSAGPSVTGGMRPDVLAPGYYVVSTLAGYVFDHLSTSGDFTSDQVVNANYAALSGTSMSSPFGAGAIALLFQHDPKLTMDEARLALIAGARPTADDFAAARDPDYALGAGILDVQRALAAIDRKDNPPTNASSLQLRVPSSFVPNDANEPVWVIGLARDADGYPADVADSAHLAAVADDAVIRTSLDHPMTGVYRFSVVARAGAGGANATLGFRSQTLSATRSVPIAADRWDAKLGLTSGGGCGVAGSGAGAGGDAGACVGALLILLRRRRARIRAPKKADRPRATGAPDRRC